MSAANLAAESNNFLLPNGTFFVESIIILVVLFIFFRFIVPPIRKAMDEREQMIQKGHEEGREAEEKFRLAEERYQEALAEARTEAAKIRDTARADAQRIVEEMRENAQREVERLRQRGQEDLESQRLQVIRELRARIGTLTVAAATELITAHLADDTNRSATVDRFLDQLEAMAAPEREPAAKGGA